MFPDCVFPEQLFVLGETLLDEAEERRVQSNCRGGVAAVRVRDDEHVSHAQRARTSEHRADTVLPPQGSVEQRRAGIAATGHTHETMVQGALRRVVRLCALGRVSHFALRVVLGRKFYSLWSIFSRRKDPVDNLASLSGRQWEGIDSRRLRQ